MNRGGAQTDFGKAKRADDHTSDCGRDQMVNAQPSRRSVGGSKLTRGCSESGWEIGEVMKNGHALASMANATHCVAALQVIGRLSEAIRGHCGRQDSTRAPLRCDAARSGQFGPQQLQCITAHSRFAAQVAGEHVDAGPAPASRQGIKAKGRIRRSEYMRYENTTSACRAGQAR